MINRIEIGCERSMCKKITTEHGFGNCKKRSKTFGELYACFIDQKISNCTDAVDSTSKPGEKISAEACGGINHCKCFDL